MNFFVEPSFISFGGSRAYGLDTESSDVDLVGFVVPPLEIRDNIFQNFDEWANKPEINTKYSYLINPKNPKIETKVYSLKKFFKLAAECNPNIIEILWVDEDKILQLDGIGRKVLENRDIFLSKQAKFRFLGYAFAQFQKIERHRKWIIKGEIKEPQRKDFGLPDETPKFMGEIFRLVKKQVEEWNFHDFGFDEEQRNELKERIWGLVGQLTTAPGWGDWPEKYEVAAIHKVYNELQITTDLQEYINREIQYKNALKEYTNWLNWKKNRNPERQVIEAKHGFDCYDDKTEFLTNRGFLLFDDIKDGDLLATFHPQKLTIEYQKPTERFESLYTGNMYNFVGYHTDVMVTANHNMFWRYREANTGKTFDWELSHASKTPRAYDFLRYTTPKHKDYSNPKWMSDLPISPNWLMQLIGWYLSDGCANFKHRSPDKPIIVISQKRGGKLSPFFKKFINKHPELASLYEYERKPNKFNPNSIIEQRLVIRNREINQFIVKNCGFTDNKHVPAFMYNLSRIHLLNLVRGAIYGDGTKRVDDSFIYYSKSKLLIDSLQIAAIHAGMETSLYGPYKQENKGYSLEMYQLHINWSRDQYRQLCRDNATKVPVQNKRTVCFSVPNGTLITRYNGHIGYHGNCKHAMHLIRLSRVGYELLQTGKINTTRPDREELLFIRNGGWSYEKLNEEFQVLDKKIEAAYAISKLPHSTDKKKINELYWELCEKASWRT